MKKHSIKTRAIAVALGATPLLFVMPLSAGARGAPAASLSPAHTSTALTSASTLPKTKIVGAPAHFKPTALTATAIETASCAKAQASFKIVNKESTGEKVKLTGTDGLVGVKGTIPASTVDFVCVSSGYTGVVTVKLTDDNTVTVTF